MEFYEREFFVYRLLSGYLKVNISPQPIYIRTPTLDAKMEAQIEYVETYERAMEEGILSDSELELILMEKELWSEEDKKNFEKVVPDHIDYWKVELYRSYLRSNDAARIRKHLDAAKNEYSRLNHLRHSYDFATCEGIASYAKTKKLILLSSYYKDGTLVDWDNYSFENVLNEYNKYILTQEQIRELARTNPWSSIWQTHKRINKDVFKNEHLSDEQMVLISWSINYDSIYESPDCPPDDIIEDDDMLDGWLIIQRKNREKSKNESAVHQAISNSDKINNAGEIFVVAQTDEDARKIDSLNSNQAARIKKARIAQIQREGQVHEGNLQDVKREIDMELTRLESQKLKGR